MILPLLMVVLVVAVVCTWAMYVLLERLERTELQARAKLVTSALEASSEIYGSAAELIGYVERLGKESSGLESITLVEQSADQVVASSVESWITRPLIAISVLRPALQSEFWTGESVGLDSHRLLFALPVELDNRSLNQLYGREYTAIVVLDASAFETQAQQIMQTVLAIGLLAVFVLFASFFLVVRSNVLQPIARVHQALRHHTSGRPFKLSRVYEDEIGELGDVISRSLTQIEASNEQVRVMSTALHASSNEVFVINMQTQMVESANPQACRNLGYTEEQLKQMKVTEFAVQLAESATLQMLTEQLTSHGEISHRYEHRRADGSTYLFEYKANLVERAGEPCLIVIGSDVTERLAQEEALRVSQERMQLALQGSNDGFFDCDIVQRTIHFSDLIQGWLKLDLADISLDEFMTYVHADDVESLSDALAGAIEEGAEVNAEFRVQDAGDGYRWVQLRGRVNDATRVLGFASDITRRKVAESLLHSTVTRLGAVLDHVDDGIATLDVLGRVCTVNPALVKLLGVSKEKLGGSRLAQFLVPDEQSDALPGWDQLADGGLHECQVLLSNGKPSPVELLARRMDGVGDERFTVVIRGIAQRKRHELQLRAAMEEAQAATEAKGNFLATMSHEIRTPMNGVMGMTQILLDTDLTDEQRETAEIIFSSGEALLTLINDILDFSKIEAGKLQLENIPFDFRTAIREVMELLAASARRKSLDLYVDYPEGQPHAFLGDVGRFRQILLNLVSNAIKFTDAGHVIVSVGCIETNTLDSTLRVSVKDTGVGIPPAVQARLFESFTQADASTTRKFGGTGLGLAICKQLVELMGGTIGVDSIEGDGAEFWFEFTLVNTELEPEAGQARKEMLAGKRILAVDDNPVGLKIVARMAASLQMQVEAITDPFAVLPTLSVAHEQGRGFDIVALDYNMPGMDGLTVATSIRGDDRLADTKLVLLTSSDLSPPSGLDGYALKPIMQEGFMRLIANALFGEQREHATDQGQDIAQTGRNLRVLLAEDNPVNQRVAVKMLERLGCRVDVAADGKEAVDMWEQFAYAMIFMDCQMPELDGLGATREIRRRESQRKLIATPIIAMTANAMAKDEEDCLAAGMDDYASKPIKMSTLAAMVQKWDKSAQPLPVTPLQSGAPQPGAL